MVARVQADYFRAVEGTRKMNAEFVLTEEQSLAYKIRKNYYDRTEEYDQSITVGRTKYGIAVATNVIEYGKMARNAQRERQEAKKEISRYGISKEVSEDMRHRACDDSGRGFKPSKGKD